MLNNFNLQSASYNYAESNNEELIEIEYSSLETISGGCKISHTVNSDGTISLDRSA